MGSSARIKGEQVPLDLMDRNGYRLVQHGLANVVRVARSEDLKAALAACQWLVAYGEGLIEASKAKARLETARIEAAKGHPGDRAQLISELKGLYAQALGSGALIVEATAETDNQ